MLSLIPRRVAHVILLSSVGLGLTVGVPSSVLGALQRIASEHWIPFQGSGGQPVLTGQHRCMWEYKSPTPLPGGGINSEM